MAPLVLEGMNLGEKHKHYNKLLKEALSDNSLQLTNINYEENDVENLIKIDIANCNKNVEYILQVLKCDDMLYVSRAIRNCSWLITNKQYAHIINPHYLDTQLLPYMSSKAICKFMLNIRLKLKEENQVDEFFKYYIEKDKKTALKWLPNCSSLIIEAAIKEHARNIDDNLLKRLCEKSIKYLEMFVKEFEEKNFGSYGQTKVAEITMFLLKKHTNKYLDIYESIEGYIRPRLGSKATQTILNKCPHRIIDNYETYIEKVHLPTLALHMKRKNINIKEFLYMMATIKALKSSCWVNAENIKPFLSMMSVEDKLEFVRNYVDKLYKKANPTSPATEFYCALEKNCRFSEKLYHWYLFAPFNEAFAIMKKLIRCESSPDERVAMLSVVLSCARNDMQNIRSLLQFYCDNHINEPFKFKIQFVNEVLSKTETYRYDEDIWSILNQIFYSMEVYIESNNNVKFCVQAIIMYNVIHKLEIPRAIEKKFSFDTFKSYMNRLSLVEKELLFTYLTRNVKEKIDAISIKDESKSDELIGSIKEAVTLLSDWNKDIMQYSWLLDIIKQMLYIKDIKAKLTFVYKIKSWRKHLFEESLRLFPTENACINALKHDSHLLYRHKSDVEVMLYEDTISMQRFLSVIRIYWPLSFANEWTIFYKKLLDGPAANKPHLCGLLTLLPQKETTELLKKFAPTESKIAWNQTDNVILAIQKQLAKYMHIARPQPTVECVLWYAKGDYLQYALPSLSSILSSLRSHKITEYVALFVNSPVSLQKNGLRIALRKLDTESKIKIIRDFWKTSKNSSIRALLFKNTFHMLCNEKEQRNIKYIWQILDSFIDDLTTSENKVVYNTLSSGVYKLSGTNVPYTVRGEYCTKSYKLLKSLPDKANCQNVLDSMQDFMELLDSEFVANILLEYIENKYIKAYGRYDYELHVLATYLLCAPNEDSSSERINKVLKPLLRHTFEKWESFAESRFFIKDNFQTLLENLGEHYENYILTKRMINPVKLFSFVQTEIENNLPIDENYVTARSWKIMAIVSEVLEKHKALLDNYEKWDKSSVKNKKCCVNIDYSELYMTAATDFGERFYLCLMEDIKLFYPSIYILFRQALFPTIRFRFASSVLFKIYKTMLRDNHVQSYLVVQLCLIDTRIDNADREIVSEIRDKMLAHPSPEVKIHYYTKFSQLSTIEIYFKLEDTKLSNILS